MGEMTNNPLEDAANNPLWTTERPQSFRWPHPSMQEEYDSGFYKTGATEPWIAQILYSLIVAKREPITVLELGGYVGTTSAWLASAAFKVNGKVIIVEVDKSRSDQIQQRLTGYWGYSERVLLYNEDVMTVIDRLADGCLGFAWVDDDHDKAHVAAELAALMPKMAPGGLICMHDVYGVTDLAGLCKQFGGIALDFPRIGPAGGLGLIQVD